MRWMVKFSNLLLLGGFSGCCRTGTSVRIVRVPFQFVYGVLLSYLPATALNQRLQRSSFIGFNFTLSLRFFSHHSPPFFLRLSTLFFCAFFHSRFFPLFISSSRSLFWDTFVFVRLWVVPPVVSSSSGLPQSSLFFTFKFYIIHTHTYMI